MDLDFDSEKIAEWVTSLLPDKRVAGLQQYEWNDTVTRVEKHAARVKKLAQIERKKREEKIRQARKAR